MGVYETIKTYTASDGYELHYRHWCQEDSPPRGYVIALHGIQSHSGWYTYSSEKLAKAGYDVAFLDRRGAGLNRQQRGDAPHEDRLIHDVVQFINQKRYDRNKRAPGAPLVLLAVSWGGKLAAATVARYPKLVDALALLYPGISARVKPTHIQTIQLKLAEILGVTQRRVEIPLNDPALFTNIPEWQQFIAEDSLLLKDLTVQFLLANRNLDREIKQSAEKVACPTLMMLASQDRIIDNSATENYFQRIATSQKELIIYPEAAHTLEFEPNREEIFDALVNWLNCR